jgi:aminoglycoside phosphotransferase (APT) family kinase protein
MGSNPFIILSKLPGENLKTLLYLNRDSLYNYPKKLNQIYYSFGKYTGSIHSNKFSEFGNLAEKREDQTKFVVGPIQSIDPTIKKGPFRTWPQYFNEVLKSRISEINHPIINEIKPKLGKFIENELAQKYCKNIMPKLCHGDLNKKNIFITGEKVSGTIDPDDSFIGNSEEDLMRLELDHFDKNPNLREIFYKGYRKYNQLEKDFEKRRPLLFVSRLLVGAMCILKFTHLYSSNIEEDLKIIRNNILQTISLSTSSSKVT